jgi:nanoRNase/pAp phosphatase (c-di-AMP/oligoRNAs hydrolase)
MTGVILAAVTPPKTRTDPLVGSEPAASRPTPAHAGNGSPANGSPPDGSAAPQEPAADGQVADGTAVVTPAAAPTRFFEDVTELVVLTIQGIEGEDVIGWAHDRIDPDTMGANGLMWYLLRERFQKHYVCYYSKRMSFLMNRSLATNFMPSGVLRRCEQTDALSEIAHKAPLIVILDATCPEIMTDFAHLIRRSKEVRHKPILFIDHHRKGSSDVEDLPNAVGIRTESAQATSAILLHVMLNLGLDLRGSEEGFRLAVVTKAGIETDLIGVDPSGYADSTKAALAYLDEVLGERGIEILEKLKAIKHPTSWYRKLGEALAEVENYDPTIAVAGLGVIDDTGIVPFVANRLMEMCSFKTTIVFGLVYDRIEGQIISVDLDASGRSTQDTEIILPDLFHDIFFVTDPAGRKTSKGGGRTNSILGDYSGAGASVPLDYWRQLSTKSADEKINVLHRLAWPAEFLRMRHLLTSRIHSLKVEEVRSVVPVHGLDEVV